VNEPETIREIFKQAKTIAVVGLSDKPGRPSLGVASYLKRHGYRIIPVNPETTEVLGEKSYPTLTDAVSAVGTIDVVDVFRASKFVAAIVDETIRLKLPYLWLQQGVIDQSAAQKAEAAGIKVVMDRCMKLAHMAV